MAIPNTISETDIQKQNNRNSSANKESETITTKNYNTIHPTQSCILHQNQTITSDIEENNSIEKKDHPTFKKQKNRKIPIQQYSSKEFLRHSAKINPSILPKSYTTTNTSTLEENINTIISYISLVIFQNMITKSTKSSTIQNISTPSINTREIKQVSVPKNLSTTKKVPITKVIKTMKKLLM